MTEGSPQQIVKGGDVTVSGGNAGPHGNGGDFTMVGGSITGGDAIGSPVAADQPTKPAPWWERPAGRVAIAAVAGIIVALVAFYFGWR